MTSTKTKPNQHRFFNFVIQRPQKIEILLFCLLALAVFFSMLYCYPIPRSYYDTNNYLQSAEMKQFIGYRPYGYSAFLILVSKLSSTTTGLFAMQFLLNLISVVYFNLTIKYIYNPVSKLSYYLFIIFSSFSPSVLFLTDYVMSDSIFISLTLIWMTTAIWILYNRNMITVALHLIILLLIIQVRYSGLFYPIFSIFVLAYSFRKNKLLALALSVLPILVGGYVYIKSTQVMHKLVGINTFSSFSGWQIANNALHITPYVHMDEADFKEPVCRKIHTFVKALPDSVYKSNGLTCNYIWDKSYPLKQYMFYTMQENNRYYLRAWVMASLEFNQYGSTVIRKHPAAFIQHYIIPNIQEMVLPSHGEILSNHTPVAKDNKWFIQDAKTYDESTVNIFEKYAPLLPMITLFQWILLLLGVICLFLPVFKKSFLQPQWEIILFTMLFIVMYLAFSIYAAPIAVRYLLPIHSLFVFLTLIAFFNTPLVSSNKTKP